MKLLNNLELSKSKIFFSYQPNSSVPTIMDVVIRADESIWLILVPVQLEWNWIEPTKLVLVSKPVKMVVT